MTDWRRRRWLLPAWLSLAAICAVAQSGANPRPSSVPPTRLSHLQRGVNLSEWFAQVNDPRGYTREHFESHTTAADIALIRSLGFDHVRLSVNPEPMFTRGNAAVIPAEYLAQVDRAVNLMVSQGLAVIIDIHPESEFKGRLARDDGFAEQFVDFWRALARHYSAFNPELVFLEILNEPEQTDRFRWIGIQAKLASVIRQNAPQHTILASGARWAANDELLFLEPLADSNVIYAFHFYEPHVFTHQGANWGAYYWNWVRGLPYPSNREATEKTGAAVPDDVSRLYVLRYGMEHWDADRIDMEINQVAEWARRHGVAVICNEFGVYRKYPEARDRAAWLHDVRIALERHNMGWTVWDYSGDFGVVTKSEGRAVPDQTVVKALGLKTPQEKP
jgi:aryl-phospho-beta-D-glucosidase BglC (GH1 family)